MYRQLILAFTLAAHLIFPTNLSSQTADDIAVAGEWLGDAISGSTVLDYRWIIDQTGSIVSGSISIKYPTDNDWSTFEFKGSFEDGTLIFSGTKWLNAGTRGFCLPTGRLRLNSGRSQAVLAGNWGANPIAGGCPAGTGGAVNLIQVEIGTLAKETQSENDQSAQSIVWQVEEAKQARKGKQAKKAKPVAKPKQEKPALSTSMDDQAVKFIKTKLLHGKFCGEIRKNVAVISQGSAVFDYFKTKNGCGAQGFTGANFEFTFLNLKSDGCTGTSRCKFSTRIQCVWQGLIMAPNCEGFEGRGLKVSGTVYFTGGKADRYEIN